VVTRRGTTNDGGGSGTTSPPEAKIIVGGPRTCNGWGNIAGSINTDACVCVPGQQSDSQQLAGSWRTNRRVDTGGHKQQPLITVGDITIVEHFVTGSTQALKTTTDSSGL